MRNFLRAALFGLSALSWAGGSHADYTSAQGALEDSPAGYTIACAIHSSAGNSGVRACAALGAFQRCEHEPEYRSQPSQEATGMTFANRSDQAVKLYWLTFSGGRKLFQTIAPGGHLVQQTFIGHNWLVATQTGQCIGVYNGAPMSIAFF